MLKALIDKAIDKRSHLLAQADTTAFRLFDGAGDGLSDLYLDQLGDHWLLSTKEGILAEELTAALSSYGKSVYWKKLDQHEKESPSLLCGVPVEEAFTVLENGLHYELSFHSGYSQGIFLDQRENRARLLTLAQSEERILNTFAYTGAFSVVASSVGATTTTLDLSQPYLDWAKRNMALNGISPEEHYFCKGDTFHWLKRFTKSGRTFHGVILDPPTFSRDDKGKIFKVERDYHKIVKLAASVLEPGGWILACTNCRKLSSWQFEEQLEEGFPDHTSLEEFSMPAEYSEEPYLKSYLIQA